MKVLLIVNIVFNSIEGSGLCPREANPVRHCVTVAGKSKHRFPVSQHVLGAVVGAPCVFPSLVAGVNITSCTRIDGDEVYNDLEIPNLSAPNRTIRKLKRKQTVQN